MILSGGVPMSENGRRYRYDRTTTACACLCWEELECLGNSIRLEQLETHKRETKGLLSGSWTRDNMTSIRRTSRGFVAMSNKFLQLQHPSLALSVIFLALFVTGCSTYHTRLFELPDKQQTCIDQYCLVPRIVAYEYAEDDSNWMDEHGFWISLRVQDKSIDVPRNPNRRDYFAKRDSLADAFKVRITTLFHVDSLVLHSLSDMVQIPALPDTTRLSPRGIDFVTYQFGRVMIPMETSRLKAVFHYSTHDPAERTTKQDSVMFEMDRIELHRKDVKRTTPTRLSG